MIPENTPIGSVVVRVCDGSIECGRVTQPPRFYGGEWWVEVESEVPDERCAELFLASELAVEIAGWVDGPLLSLRGGEWVEVVRVQFK